MILLISLAGAVLSFFAALSLIIYFRKRNKVDIFYRMRRHNVSDVKLTQTSQKTFLENFYELIQRIAKPFENKKIFQKLDLKLKQAGIQFSGAEFTIMILLVAFAAGMFVYMLTINQSLARIAGLSIPLAGWVLIMVKIRKRKIAFTEQLGDCLITIANALRAGYSFQQAIDVIAKEMEPPINQEFIRASTDIKMGMPLESALEEMDKRVNSTDFTLVVTAVLIQREVGGNLAQILDTISDTIMERIRMKREINALTAQGRLSAMVLLCLPFAMAVFMYFASPEQMQLLLEEPSGQMAIIVAIIMDIIGYVIIQKIVNIEV